MQNEDISEEENLEQLVNLQKYTKNLQSNTRRTDVKIV